MKSTVLIINPVQNTSITDFKSKTLLNDKFFETSHKILSEIMKFRRLPKHHNLHGNSTCDSFSPIHLQKIGSAIKNEAPITFVLPGFPCKSPNTNKVLGTMPDYAEIIALSFLAQLCSRIKNIYPPGIKIIICSDGRVFSDIIGVKENHVTEYQIELDRLIKDMSLSDLSTFNLDHFYHELSFVQMRNELMENYGNSYECLRRKVRNGAKSGATNDEEEANRMYRGITRFLFEDSMYPGQIKSRAAMQKEAKSKAYEVIRRSNAWSDLIEEQFPDAVRLSIHPQACGAKKLGIRLVGNESWMTPWHGVAVETSNGYVLLKRSEAEELGAKLIYDSLGRPSHYKLTSNTHILDGIN